MKKIQEVTIIPSDEYVVQFTEKLVLDKTVCLTVPRGYIALGYIDEKLMFKAQQCSKKNVLSLCGKEYSGKQIQFAFYSSNIKTTFSYGFGPINVNNERLKEAYRVGVNGQITLEVVDFVKLINSYSYTESVTVDMLKEQILPVIKSVGMPLVSDCFVDSKVSVFEINSQIDDIRQKMVDKLIKENLINSWGIKVLGVTVNEIFVNEDDLEMIRNRINN